MKRLLFIILCLGLAGPIVAAPKTIKADALYQSGLKAYLYGDYDQAILYAAQAVKADPGSQKAQDLLSVLVAEKEKNTSPEIWIGDPDPKPTPPGCPDLEPLRVQLRQMKEELETLKKEKEKEAPPEQEVVERFEKRMRALEARERSHRAVRKPEPKVATEPTKAVPVETPLVVTEVDEERIGAGGFWKGLLTAVGLLVCIGLVYYLYRGRFMSKRK